MLEVAVLDQLGVELMFPFRRLEGICSWDLVSLHLQSYRSTLFLLVSLWRLPLFSCRLAYQRKPLLCRDKPNRQQAREQNYFYQNPKATLITFAFPMRIDVHNMRLLGIAS